MKTDRWDELLTKTMHRNEDFRKDDEFAFFDDDHEMFMDDEKLVVVSDKVHHVHRDEDLLKQIYDKEFIPKIPYEQSVKTIQKPPRKSIENRRSMERERERAESNYSSRSSMRFDD
jgi:hypothetical protein